MRKWFTMALAVMLVLAVVLTGCGPKATPTAVPPTKPVATQVPPTAVPPTEVPKVTITMWEQEEEQGRNTVLYPLVNEFMAANPNITVEVTNYGNEELRTQFQTASLAGQAPEIIRCPNDFAGVFAAMDIILPITDMFGQPYLATMLPGALAGAMVGGKLWGLPDQSGNHLMLLYNKAFIETPPADSDEWIQVAQEHTDEAAGTWGLAFNTTEPFWLAPFLGGFGGWVLDDETDLPTLNTPEMVKALQFMGDLVNKYKVVPPGCDYDTADVLFKEGKAAMIINGDWSLGGYAQIEGLDFGTAPMPLIKETGLWPTPMTSGRYYMVSNAVQPGTPKFDAVKKFVEFMTGEYAQTQWLEKFKKLPCNLVVCESPLIEQDPILRGSAAQLAKGRGMPAAPQLRCFWDSARPGQQGVIAGTQTPEEAAVKMQEDADRCIEEAGLGPTAKPTAVPTGKFRVGYVTDTGGIDDRSFNTNQWEGILRAKAELDIEAQFIQSDEATQYEANLTEFASQGYDLIFASGFFLGGDLAKVAAQYPDLKFTIVDYAYPDPFGVPEGVVGNKECIPNVMGQVFKTDQAAFLAGYLAAGMTKTGKLGYFGGAKIPTVTIFGVGFQAGMERYNEVHGTNVELIGWDNKTGEGLFTGDFTDLTKGKEMTESLFDEGADIFIPVGGLIGSPGFDVARERGGYGVWVDVDGYNLLPTARDVLLTSVMKKMDVSCYTVIQETMVGRFKGCGTYIGSLANGGVGLAPYHDLEAKVPTALKAEIDELKMKIVDGDIKDTGCLSYPQWCPGGLY